MVTTAQVKPSPLLQPYISCYALRIFNSENGLPKPQHAQNEYYLSFFLKKDRFCELLDDEGNFQKKLANTLCTLYTQPQGCILFRGNFHVFSIQFKANGVYSIFGIPQRLLINGMLPVDDVLGNDMRQLTEQLESCESIAQMSLYMNAYLVKKFQSRKHKYYTGVIAAISNDILRNKGLVNIDNLAFDANMSFRNFERRFTEEVGVSPKLYIRVTRFYEAIKNKMMNPQKNWTDISYESGYFDQAHFIRECKQFSSKAPEQLFKYAPPPAENVKEKDSI